MVFSKLRGCCQAVLELVVSATLATVALVAISFPHPPCQAEEVTVFDMRNSLALKDSDPVYKDFYLNGGTEQGLRKDMIITVVRRQTLYDSYQNRSPGDLMVKVGLIKIIHVQRGLSVARDFASVARVDHPLLENDFVMVGDLIDLKSAYLENGSGGKKSEHQASTSTNTVPANEPNLSVPQEPEPALKMRKSELASKAVELNPTPVEAPN